MPIKDLTKELVKMERKGKKEGYENITIYTGLDEGDDDNLPRYYIEAMGNRLETEEEWHNRLEDYRTQTKRTIENASRISKNSPSYIKKIEDIDEALKGSKLRCEMCGMPCSCKIFMSNWKKARRLCNTCTEKTRASL